MLVEGRISSGRRSSEVDREDERGRDETRREKERERGCHQISYTSEPQCTKKKRKKSTHSRGKKLGQSITDVERQAEERKKNYI